MESSLSLLHINLPKKHEYFLLSDRRDWNQRGDMTTLLVQDAGVLNQFRRYLHDWVKTMRNVTMPDYVTCNYDLFNLPSPKNAEKKKKDKRDDDRENPFKKRRMHRRNRKHRKLGLKKQIGNARRNAQLARSLLSRRESKF